MKYKTLAIDGVNQLATDICSHLSTPIALSSPIASPSIAPIYSEPSLSLSQEIEKTKNAIGKLQDYQAVLEERRRHRNFQIFHLMTPSERAELFASFVAPPEDLEFGNFD